MTCDKALAERLIEITSKPLQNYKKNRIVTGYDPDFGYPDNDYVQNEYVWDISKYKRLVLITQDDDTLAPGDENITHLYVLYHIGGFKLGRSRLNFKTFPSSILSTLTQFAYDGIKAFKEAENTKLASYNSEVANDACKHAMRVLS